MTDGRLCYLDFGMMGRIDERTRQGLMRATLHMVNREFDELAKDFVTLGMLPEESKTSQAQIVAALRGAPPFNAVSEARAGRVGHRPFCGQSVHLGAVICSQIMRRSSQ